MLCAPSDRTAGLARRRDRPHRRRGAWTIVIHAAVALAFASCRGTPAAQPQAVQAGPASSPPSTAGAAPHGDHNPHHGGIVMMKGDNLHYEVVLDPDGRAHRVYFSDAVREDLPAAVASDVVLSVRRPGAAEERIPLHIDDAGESWVGAGRPIAGATATTVRVSFSIQNEAYWIDLPFTPSKQ